MIKWFAGAAGLSLLCLYPFFAADRGAAAVHEAACRTCPECGCNLVPTCRATRITKKVTEYKYHCISEDICVPGVTPLSAACGDSGDCVCPTRCTVRSVHKLVKHPVAKETPTTKYTVEWTCPNCRKDAVAVPSLRTTAAPDRSVPQEPPPLLGVPEAETRLWNPQATEFQFR